MSLPLPPLRLTGATALRDGVLAPRSVAIAAGRITRGPLPAADLPGRLVLPGLVDLCAGSLGGAADPARALLERARRAAAAGITTAWLALPWDPGAAETLAIHRTLRARLAIDLRLKLLLPTEAAGDPRLLAAVAAHGIDYVVFEGPAAITPALCGLADALDRLGVRYASRGDADAATRERFHRLGAAVAEHPATAEAAAAARAMMAAVVAGADRPGGESADALCSAGHAEGLLAAALRRASRMPFARAFAAVSRTPADLLGLIDRGRIAPGRRADLIAVDPATGRVEVTVAGGRIVHAAGEAAERLAAAGLPACA